MDNVQICKYKKSVFCSGTGEIAGNSGVRNLSVGRTLNDDWSVLTGITVGELIKLRYGNVMNIISVTEEINSIKLPGSES